MPTYRLASEAEKRIEQSRKYSSNSVLKNLGVGLSRALDPTIWDNGAADDQQNQLTFQAIQKKHRGEKLAYYVIFQNIEMFCFRTFLYLCG